MSTLVYGSVTRQRKVTAPGESVRSPGVKTSVDIFAAIVPAEVLGVQAFVTSQCVRTTTNPDGSAVTVIVHPDPLKYAFFALLLASSTLFLLGHGLRDLGPLDLVRALIPPLAFAGWTAMQTNTALDVLVPGFVGAPALVTMAVVAIILAPLANKLGVRADQQSVPPPEATATAQRSRTESVRSAS